MIVCICNALNERSVRSAINGSDQTVPGVFRALETKPRCGKCVEHMEAMLKDHGSAPGNAVPLAAAAD